MFYVATQKENLFKTFKGKFSRYVCGIQFLYDVCYDMYLTFLLEELSAGVCLLKEACISWDRMKKYITFVFPRKRF